MELFKDRVQPCHWNFKCQALGWLRTLYTGLARNIKFEILGCLEALEDLYIKVEHFHLNIFLDFEEKYGKISHCRTFNYFKCSHFIAGTRTSATLTVCVTILICCFACTTTPTTLLSASFSPRAGNFNWPLIQFKKDGKLQWKKNVWMKTWWNNIFTLHNKCDVIWCSGKFYGM